METSVLLTARSKMDAASEHAACAFWVRSQVEKDFHTKHMVNELRLAAEALGFKLVPFAADQPDEAA